MTLATVVVSSLLATALVLSATRKLSHQAGVVATYTRVGVRESQLNALALVLVAGAAGLLLGLLWAPIGVAASAGLVVYFLLAIGAHVRADDLSNLPVPITLELLAIATLVLRIGTL
jgi:uncharacterized membrane protein YbjE (DUF340 family)